VHGCMQDGRGDGPRSWTCWKSPSACWGMTQTRYVLPPLCPSASSVAGFCFRCLRMHEASQVQSLVLLPAGSSSPACSLSWPSSSSSSCFLFLLFLLQVRAAAEQCVHQHHGPLRPRRGLRVAPPGRRGLPAGAHQEQEQIRYCAQGPGCGGESSPQSCGLLAQAVLLYSTVQYSTGKAGSQRQGSEDRAGQAT